MKKLLALFAVCSIAFAMVPRERRALNEEDVPRTSMSTTGTSTTTAKPKEICAPQTPCGWAIYNPVTRAIQTNITNTYCNCSDDKVCSVTEDDSAISTYVFHCRLPSESEDFFDS